uniref:AT23657p1 n=1 Tax=Drosophila melanogaster TaxID=7227 RepID=G4LU29_DROME|nr:AT23657p1 [Drosophila melanogaster]
MVPLRGTNAVWAKSMSRTSTKHWLSSVGGADMSSDFELCCRSALRRCSLLLSRSRPDSRDCWFEILSQLRSCGAALAGEDTAETGVEVIVDFFASRKSDSPRLADC